MALARSASVPGGLSINTGAANLFGSTSSQPPAAGGLFGAATSQPAAPAKPSLFGGAAATTASQATTSTPAATPSLFGSAAAGSTATATTQPASGGLFGQAAAAKPATPSLFGAAAQPAAAAATSAPASGGLFGGGAAAATSAAAPTNTAAPTLGGGGGLFGAQPAKPAGGLFGGAAPAAATAAPAAGGLFGASTAAQPQAGGLFGASTAAAAQPQASSLFSNRPGLGTSTAQPAATLGGQQQQQQQQAQQAQNQQVVPGVRIDVSQLKGTTRFNDLQESLQKDLLAFDSLIQSYVEQKNQVEAFMPAHAESLAAIPADVRFVARKYDGVSAALGGDLQSIQGLRETVKQDAEHAQLSFQALDNQKLPAQFHTSGLWRQQKKKKDDGGESAGDAAGGGGGGAAAAAASKDSSSSDLINYFSQTGDDIDGQLKRLEKNLGEIEVHMYGVQAGLLEQLQKVAAKNSNGTGGQAGGQAGGGGGNPEDGSSGGDDKVAELAAVLRDFEESILSVASVVGSARESMTALQLGGFLGRR